MFVLVVQHRVGGGTARSFCRRSRQLQEREKEREKEVAQRLEELKATTEA